jgi:pseudouridine-5'-phosphate glycosidase
VPATIAVIEGRITIGLSSDELGWLGTAREVLKLSRADLPYAVSARRHGSTTVAAAMICAHLAGIPVFATGGIGGVHRGSGDVSADLLELARTKILLVCSGPKSIVDPDATAERLEELGVAIVGYRCERLPFFLAEASEVELDQRVEDPTTAARLVHALWRLEASSAVLLCNPIPATHAMDGAEIATVVRACEAEADRRRVRGKAVTPFLLSCVAERTDGRSLESNLALLEANARLAGEVAVAAATTSPV